MIRFAQQNSGLQGGICIALAVPDTQSAINAAKPLEKDVDVVEIRLDGMREVDIPKLCQNINRPLLFTNRPTWEGGQCDEPEEKRLDMLIRAVRAGAAYVDLEIKTAAHLRGQLIDEVRRSKAYLISSCHDFEKTPDPATLSAILQQQMDSGAHIGKIVTMAHSYLDVLQVLHLQCEAKKHNFPLIAFCMGAAGKISRIATLLLGGFMTYAALNEEQATAPGQLTVGCLKEAMVQLTEKTV